MGNYFRDLSHHVHLEMLKEIQNLCLILYCSIYQGLRFQEFLKLLFTERFSILKFFGYINSKTLNLQ